MAELKTKIILRNDTAANWISANPILSKGEFGVETDTGLFKIGTGLKNWADLAYANKFDYIPLADEATVTVDPDTGRLALHGLEGLDAHKTYVPSIVNGVLVWNEPDTETAEGQATAIAGLTERMVAVEGRADDLETAVEGIEALIGTVEEGKTLVEMIAAAEYNDDDLQDKYSTLNQSVETAKGDIEQLRTDVNTATTKLGSLDETVAKHTDDISTNVTNISKNASAIQELTQDIVDLTSVVNEKANADEVYTAEEGTLLAGRMTTAETNIGTLQEQIKGLSGAMHFVGTKDTVPTDVTGYASGDVIAVGNKEYVFNGIAFVELGDITQESKRLEEAETAIAGLTSSKADADQVALDIAAAQKAAETTAERALLEATTELDGKITNNTNKFNEYYTKTEADSQYSNLEQAIENNTAKFDGYYTKAQVDTALTGKVDKVEGSRLITSTEADKLALLDITDGELTLSGSVTAGQVKELDEWIVSHRDTIAGLFSTTDASKLAGIASNAQVNVIEKVKVGGVEVTPDGNKLVNIPFATADLAGVVKSATEMNTVAVGANGVMSVNNISVEKLQVPEGTTFILNGGTASA